MVKVQERIECPTCLGGTNPDYSLHPCPECWGSQKIPQVPCPARNAILGMYRWLADRITKLTVKRSVE